MAEKKKISDTQITEEHIENLKAQVKEYSQLAKQYESLTLKAMGALEVLTELKDK